VGRAPLPAIQATWVKHRVFSSAILWTHAAAGAIWVGACACFVIAGMALATWSIEQRNFAETAAPKIDLLGLVAAALLLVTGLINLTTAGVSRGFVFSTAFITVLAIKIALFIVMIVVMTWSMRIGAAIRAVVARERTDAVPGAMSRMVAAHVAIVAMGGVALILGTWLMGS
jgi:putative copper export protein